MSWVRVSPEAADFSRKKKSSSGVVELCCVSLYIECVSKFVYHVYTWFGVWRLWWFNYPGLLLNTKLEFAC